MTTLWTNAKLKILDFLKMELKKLPQGIFVSSWSFKSYLTNLDRVYTDLMMLHVWFLILAIGIRCHFCRCLYLKFSFWIRLFCYLNCKITFKIFYLSILEDQSIISISVSRQSWLVNKLWLSILEAEIPNLYSIYYCPRCTLHYRTENIPSACTHCSLLEFLFQILVWSPTLDKAFGILRAFFT